MKRTREKDTTQKMWPSIAMPGIGGCDRIKEAVVAACWARGTDTYLPRQPVMLYCVGEDVSVHTTIAYWPRDPETGIMVLRRLADTKNVADIDKHCELVEILVDIAENKPYDETNQSIKKRCLLTLINGVNLSEAGLFALIRDDSYKGYDADPPYIGAHYIEMSELAPHLYYQECLRFM